MKVIKLLKQILVDLDLLILLTKELQKELNPLPEKMQEPNVNAQEKDAIEIDGMD